ncbi:MAG: hypothetical protein WDN23_18280 [Edaphobacter sp.]
MEIITSQSKAQATPTKAEPPSAPTNQSDDRYMDRSDDLVARVRAAREAAQRRMDAFGKVAEYEVRVVRGRKGVV